MGRAKIPRKSTTVDMTAMCDVAFLLLTFFIMATKQKPAEVLAVKPPNSISAKAAPDKAYLFTLTEEGKVFLSIGEDGTKRADILKSINTAKGLGLSDQDLAKWNRQEFVGLPLNQVKGYLEMANPPAPNQLPGIPTDSTNNELIDWVKAIVDVNAGGDQNELQQKLLVKGDQQALYPKFRAIKDAFKKNQIFKFRIITNGEPVPVGSELYMNSKGEGTPKE